MYIRLFCPLAILATLALFGGCGQKADVPAGTQLTNLNNAQIQAQDAKRAATIAAHKAN